MSDLSRRDVLKYGAIGAAGVAVSLPLAQNLLGQAEAAMSPIVVVGGGMAGVTVAKYLRMWGNKQVPVTLIEEHLDYTSNIMSNLVLTGQKSLSSLHYSYSTLKTTWTVNVLQGTVTNVTGDLANGFRVTYTNSRGTSVSTAASRVVFANGIDFAAIPNFTGTATQKAKVVHAWSAEALTTDSTAKTKKFQVQSLRDQLVAMPTGGKVIITIPAKPYRCPPGPYERAALIADWVKKNRRGGITYEQVIVLDANPTYQAEAHTFEQAFTVIHRGVVKYVPNAVVTGVDAATKTVRTTQGDFTGNVLNVIPDHTAPRLLHTLGLATTTTPNGQGAFCPVDVLSYESKVTPGIHVLGDASATDQPKAGHIANQEAKVCADAILRLIDSSNDYSRLDPSPVTNSACYSPITSSTASWLTAVYQYNPATGRMSTSGAIEAPAITTDNFSQMNTWFNTLMADSFR